MADTRRIVLEGKARHIEKLLRWARGHVPSVHEVSAPARRAPARRDASPRKK